MDTVRRLAYRFLSLPYHKRIELAQTLSLIADEDRGVPDSMLFARFFQRARQQGKLGELWALVEREYGAATSPNPFEKQEEGRAQ